VTPSACTVSFAERDQKVVLISLVIAILHSHLVNKCEEITVKIPATTVILVLLSTAAAFAESPKQLGAWSIYTAEDNHVVMLQSMSTAQDHPAKLDVVCRNGKLSAIALEPSVAIEKSALSFTAVVPTTRVAYSLEGQANPSEQWAVLDNGRTLSPYSEASEGKVTRRWAERIAGTRTIGFQLDGKAGESLSRSTFETGQLAEALSSVGCSY
jgi:hypothetical protein